jgi:3',5'-cyclic AMP phosphodiesterase CpdA
LDKPIRFVVGGDAFQTTKLFHKMNETVAALDPLFCVIGGDIAYALFHPLRLTSSLGRWREFLEAWTEEMVAPDGRLIPFLLASGNHDIASDNYETFFSLFALPEKRLYRAVDFGSYLSLILLDTAHFQPVEGQQTAWLEKTLAGRKGVPYRFAIYHEAAYPSFYPYNGEIPKKIRKHWCPLFDKYRLPIAFENHNHAFKRTHPIKNNSIDPDGVLYLGDGCWGAKPRQTNDLWYLAKRARKNNVYLIDLTAAAARIQAIDIQGEPLDSVTLRADKLKF